MKYIVESQVNLSMIDFLLTQIKELESIKKKNVTTAVNLLTDIKNVIYGWKFNEEKIKIFMINI